MQNDSAAPLVGAAAAALVLGVAASCCVARRMRRPMMTVLHDEDGEIVIVPEEWLPGADPASPKQQVILPRTGGQTNLWAGLEMDLEALRAATSPK